MAQNLRTQLRDAVIKSFREGVDKHALKKQENGLYGVISSYGSKFSTLDVVDDFAKFIKENKIPCRFADQLTKDVVERYLIHKANSGCTQKTVDSYRDRLAKVGECVSVQRHIALDLRVAKVVSKTPPRADRGAGAAISRADYDKILAYCQHSSCGSAFAVLMEDHLGGRVTDVCERMTVRGDQMHMVCKNGKELLRPITPELAKILADKRFARYRAADGFKLPKSGSVNRFLARTEKTLGLANHSFHDIRRLKAQERYDQLRQNGMGRTEALRDIGVYLNHGDHREDLVLKSYIANAW